MLVPFVGYSVGRRFIGYVECGTERLPEMLNHNQHVIIRDAYVESFDDDTITNLGDGELDRSILYAIEAPPGGIETSRRIRTPRQRLQVQLGPYTALGLLDVPEGQLPLPGIDGAGPMVQLSDATLGYSSHGQPNLRDVGTLLVNREKLDWVRASDAEAQAFTGVLVVTDQA